MKRWAIVSVCLATILSLDSRLLSAQYVQKNFILTTTPDWIADVTATNYSIVNSCESANYIWGQGNVYPRFVWKKSKTSGDWTPVWNAGSTTAVLSDENSVLISFNGSSSGKYSTDEGLTWNQVSEMPDFDTTYYTTPWRFAHHNGIFILGEYLAQGHSRPRLFRSTDNGATWSTVYTDTDVDGMNNSHIHCVTYHAGLNAFIAVVGDGPNRAYLKSNSDGTNWIRLMISKGSQPIQLLDYGNPTRILCGSDTHEGVASCDLITETSYNVLNDHWTVTELGADGECWALKKCEGIYYAFSFYEGSPKAPFAGDRWPKCFVSLDGENWATYHQIPTTSTTIQGVMGSISGIAQGYLHVTIYDNQSQAGSYKLKSATLTNQPALFIQSNGSNLLNTPDKAYFATPNCVPNEWVDSGLNATLTSESTGGLFGTGCIKDVKPFGLPGYIMIAPAQSRLQYTSNGRKLYARAWVRGAVTLQNTLEELSAILDTSKSTSYGNDQTRTWSRLYLNDPLRWIEILTISDDLSIRGDISDCYLRLQMGNSTGAIIDANSSATIYAGGAMVSDTPVALIPNDVNDPITYFDYQTTVGNQWTSYSTIIPDVSFQTIRYFWYPWRPGTTADTNDYCTHDSGAAGPGKVYKSAQNSNASEPPVNWTEVTDANKQPRWHIQTLEDMNGNKLVLYLDCIPYYAAYLTEIQGRKIKLDIYIDGVKKETLEQANPFAWDRHSQWQIAISADTAIKLFVSHSESTIPEMLTSSNPDVAAALSSGAFKNCVISHHYGDIPDMQSFTFYTVYNASKEKDSVPDTAEACRAEMNVIDSTDNPIIQQQPQNITVCKDTSPSFTVSTTSSPGCLPLHYQWKSNGANVGTDTSVLTLANVQLSDNGSVITCEVSNSCGSAFTNPVLLTVTPIIQPKDVTVCKGNDAAFSVGVASGCEPVHYQWKNNGLNIGMDTAVITLPDVQLSDDGSVITCEVNNSCEQVTTNPAILHVTSIITQQPQDVFVQEGATVTFTTDVALDCRPAYYCWMKNGSILRYTYNPYVTLTNVQLSDNGSVITCIVSGPCGFETTVPAILNIIHTVNASSGPGGSIDPNGNVSVICGADQVFTAIPDPNYVAFQWYVDGNQVQETNNVFTLPNICADHNVSVTFTTNTHIINACSGPNGYIDPNGNVPVIHGLNQIFTAIPDPNYVVSYWYVDGNLAQEGGPAFTLFNIRFDHSVCVTFTEPIHFSDELILLFNSWLEDEPAVDVAPSPDGDGIVNFMDYAILAQRWQEGLAQ